MKKILIIIGLIISIFAQARETSRVGNGGRVIFCKGRAPILLDIYESQYNGTYTFHKLEFMENDDTDSLLPNRVGLFFPKIASLVKNLKKYFHKKKQFVENVSFKIPDDFRNLYYEDSCSLQVVAVQRQPLLSFDKVFFLNKNLWNQLGKAQFTLIDHEVLYLLAILNGAKDSVKVRQTLAYFLSDQFDKNDEQKAISKLTDAILNGSIELDEDLIIGRLCDGLSKYRFQCENL